MIPYIINVALILAGCLVFYTLLLRKETFYKVNRYVLVVCLFISFSLPLLPISPKWSLRKKEPETVWVEQKTPVVQKATSEPPPVPPQGVSPMVVDKNPTASTTTPVTTTFKKVTFSNIITWLGWLYWFGVIIFGANFLMQLIVLIRKAIRNPVIVDGQYRIVEVSGDKAPCSFGNTIYINPEKYDWETYTQILQHEKVHVRQNHSVDILLAELVLIFQWFNPFAWLYRRQIESNLEFLTDNELTQREQVEKTSYQLSLLKVSAPHFPLSLTTNYNQSILKKRIAMMNTKRSNMHTAWKYFFLLPVLALFACLLNEPKAQTKSITKTHTNENVHHRMSTEGYWFAVIKEDKVNIRFSEDQEDDFGKDGGSYSGTTFKLSELSSMPKGSEGKFTITREAGTMEMTGKFENTTGMGRYKFKPDESYMSYMSTELKEKLDEDDQMAFWFVDVKKSYLQMLRSEGYANVDKDDLIPMAALHIDQAYIKSIKENGFKDVSMEDLVPLKALGVDAAYIKEIREAGLKNVDVDKIVSFKAQGIDKAYISKIKDLKGKDFDPDDEDGDDIVSFKAMGIDDAYIKSFTDAGLKVPNDQLVAYKALGVTPEYIKSWHNAGFKDIDYDEFTGMKSQNVTIEYMKSFTNLGYKDIKPEDLVSFRALGITPEYIKSFEAAGYKITDLDEMPGLKSQGITPEFIKSFEEVGFKNIPLDEIISVKAMGVTPAYIKEMRAKGFNYDKLHKYVTLKSID